MLIAVLIFKVWWNFHINWNEMMREVQWMLVIVNVNGKDRSELFNYNWCGKSGLINPWYGCKYKNDTTQSKDLIVQRTLSCICFSFMEITYTYQFQLHLFSLYNSRTNIHISINNCMSIGLKYSFATGFGTTHCIILAC